MLSSLSPDTARRTANIDRLAVSVCDYLGNHALSPRFRGHHYLASSRSLNEALWRRRDRQCCLFQLRRLSHLNRHNPPREALRSQARRLVIGGFPPHPSCSAVASTLRRSCGSCGCSRLRGCTASNALGASRDDCTCPYVPSFNARPQRFIALCVRQWSILTVCTRCARML